MCHCLKRELVGLCKSCVDKYKQKYMQRGFSEQEAERMATKLLKRVRRRQRYEILKGIRNSFQSWLYRWCFLTQWRATLYASARNLKLTWIGKGFNPDYSQACVASGSGYCTDDPASPCSSGGNLCMKAGCACSCPSPSQANSHYVSNTCNRTFSGTCICDYIGEEYYCARHGGSPACGCGSGSCWYSCDSGYSWNGSQCVVSAARKTMIGDGSTCIIINA